MLFRGVLAEVEARGAGDASLFEKIAGQCEAVRSQCGTVAVEVERTFWPGGDPQAKVFQGGGEKIAAAAEFGSARFEDADRFRRECRQRRVLRRRRRAEHEVLRQLLDVAHEGLGNHHPAQAPAGHLEVLGEAVDDPDVVAGSAGGGCVTVVGETVVDLVDQEVTVASATGIGQRGNFGQAQQCASRIRRGGNQ